MTSNIAEIQDKKEHNVQQTHKVPLDPNNEVARRQMESDAARTVQRTYRGYRERRHMQGLQLDPGSRWTEAIREAQYRKLIVPRSRGTDKLGSPTSPPGFNRTTSSAKSHWNLAGTIARRANVDEESSLSDSSHSSLPGHHALSPSQQAARKERRLAEKQERVKSAKTMDLSYFLEMVDVKHRYGSNLRKYHAEWKSKPTNENFFFWLDHGEGRSVELPNCSRKRLGDMQVRYLNREERMLYEAVVDGKGRLVWKKDGVRVDTTDRWRDSVEGIVRVESEVPLWADRPVFSRGSSESSGVESEGEMQVVGGRQDGQEQTAEKEVESPTSPPGDQKPKVRSPLQEFFKIPAGGKRLQKKKKVEEQQAQGKKKTKKKSQQWIFVADTKNNLYIGIKQAGAFQHSSFLHGSRVSVAGLINVRDGQLRILQPRSGHYRTPSHNLHIFIKSLQSRDVDMSMTAVGGSYAAMVGIEGFMKTRGRWRDVKEDVKKRVEGMGVG